MEANEYSRMNSKWKHFFVLKKTIDVQRKKYTKQLQVLFASSFIFHLVFFILENTSF